MHHLADLLRNAADGPFLCGSKADGLLMQGVRVAEQSACSLWRTFPSALPTREFAFRDFCNTKLA